MICVAIVAAREDEQGVGDMQGDGGARDNAQSEDVFDDNKWVCATGRHHECIFCVRRHVPSRHQTGWGDVQHSRERVLQKPTNDSSFTAACPHGEGRLSADTTDLHHHH